MLRLDFKGADVPEFAFDLLWRSERKETTLVDFGWNRALYGTLCPSGPD